MDIPFMGMVMSFGELLLPLLDTFGGSTAAISKLYLIETYSTKFLIKIRNLTIYIRSNIQFVTVQLSVH